MSSIDIENYISLSNLREDHPYRDAIVQKRLVVIKPPFVHICYEHNKHDIRIPNVIPVDVRYEGMRYFWGRCISAGITPQLTRAFNLAGISVGQFMLFKTREDRTLFEMLFSYALEHIHVINTSTCATHFLYRPE